jgi:acetyl-CoA carboxylase biotin carboxyl carrier protein
MKRKITPVKKDIPVKIKAATEITMNLKEIESLIKFVQHSGVAEVSLEQKDFKLTIKATHGATYVNSAPQLVHSSTPSPQPAAATPQPPAAEVAKPADTSKLITIKSPMIGTFYRSASPDKPLFVNVGDEIKQGQVLCIIEAMKLFNEIESEVSGKIVKVLVDNSTPVEYDQPLFLVEPK